MRVLKSLKSRNPHYPETLTVQRGGFSYYGQRFKVLGDARYLYDKGATAVYIADGVDPNGDPCRLYFNVDYRDVDIAKEGRLAWGWVFSDMERLVPDAWRVRAIRGTFNIDSEMEQSDVRTMDDLRRFYSSNHQWTAPYLADPEVWSWIRDYYSYVEENEHGNQPSLKEDAKEGYMASLIADLVEMCDSQYTDYLAASDDTGPLLERRAAIQKRHGVKPDWKASRNRRSRRGRRRCSAS